MVKVMECQTCFKQFNHKGKYKKHMMFHEGVKPFKCPECGVLLAAEWILKRHRETKHSGLKPYVCFECNVSFTSRDHLHRHLGTRKHEPFKCEKCGKVFLRINAYQSHKCGVKTAEKIEVKPEEKEQEIPDAGCKFDREKIAKGNTEEGEKFRCCFDGCVKEYSTRSNLRTHIRVAHEKVGFTCEYCKSVMMHNHTLQKHILICSKRSVTVSSF